MWLSILSREIISFLYLDKGRVAQRGIKPLPGHQVQRELQESPSQIPLSPAHFVSAPTSCLMSCHPCPTSPTPSWCGLPPQGAVCMLAGTQLLRLLRPRTRVSPPENCSRWVQMKQLGIDGVCREINQRQLAAVPGAAWAQSILMNPELLP